jgi:hypothetical protein
MSSYVATALNQLATFINSPHKTKSVLLIHGVFEQTLRGADTFS